MDRCGTVARALRARGALLFRRGRTPGLRTAKTTLAAVTAFVLADWLHTSDEPILAPLTALLVVQLTMYETIAHGRERIVSVVAGVLVAVGFASVAGLTWWSLGAVVAVSLVAGRLLRLGPHLPEVPISAMLVLAVGGAESAAAGRVIETLIGAAVGVLVNLVIAPPLYIQPASDAIGELADRMGLYCRDLAAVLRSEWSRSAADSYLNLARGLSAEVSRADERLAHTERSARLNPRGRLAREVQPRLRIALTALEHAQVGLRNLARALLDRTYYVPEDQADTIYDPDTRAALADVLEAVAAAVEGVVPIASGAASSRVARDQLERHLAELKRRRDRLGTRLLVDPHADSGAWQQHGALLAAIDRLRVEIEAAVRPSDTPWRPPPLTARQRKAVRRAITVAAEHHPSRAAAGRGRVKRIPARLGRRRIGNG